MFCIFLALQLINYSFIHFDKFKFDIHTGKPLLTFNRITVNFELKNKTKGMVSP